MNSPHIFLAFDESSVFYEIGYSNDNCLLLSLDGENYLFTDGRYAYEATVFAKNCTVIETRELAIKAAQILRTKKAKSVTVDTSQWKVQDFELLQKRFTGSINKKVGFLTRKRIVKTPQQIEHLRLAAQKGARAFGQFADWLAAHEGASEQKSVYESQRILTREGELKLSFEPIVAFGENAALPHARPTARILKYDDTVLFDAGVKVDGYCSDRTRTAVYTADGFSWDKNQKFKDAAAQKVYDTVLSAQLGAIESVKEGMKASRLDAVARNIIEKAGFGDRFIHSLGHGVGLDIHELPIISAKSRDVLTEGMVFTIEPGIYIPGFIGVRIEDTVVIKNGRAEILG